MVEPLSPAQQSDRAALPDGGRVRPAPVGVRISHFRLRHFKPNHLCLLEGRALAFSQPQSNKENTQAHRDAYQPYYLGKSSREKRTCLPHRRICHRTLVHSTDRPRIQGDGDPTPITRNHSRQRISFHPKLDRISHGEWADRSRVLLPSKEP